MVKNFGAVGLERYTKIILLVIALLLSLDATLLFAAQQVDDSHDVNQQLKQIQQLQQLAQQSPQNGSINQQGIMGGEQSAPPSAALQQALLPSAPPSAAVAPIGGQGQTTQSAPQSSMMGQQSQTDVSPQGFGPAGPAAPQGGGQSLAAPSVDQSMMQSNLSQQQMVMAVDQQAIMREAAFNSVVQAMMPLSPDQIQKLRQQFNASQLAAQSEAGTPPRPVASSKVVSLAPGATPPVVRLAQGFVSSLVFVDSTGAPWPIKAYDLGNPGAFNIQWDKQSNTLMIQAMRLYTYGNLAVQLDGLPTPVMITLVPGQKAVDYRVDLRIQGAGPNAKAAPTGTGLPGAASPVLLGVLDGVPPPGSRSYPVVGGYAQAWVKGERLYLRTRMTVISPGWIATMTSADGTKAYELPHTPMLLAADNGKVVQLKIEGL